MTTKKSTNSGSAKKKSAVTSKSPKKQSLKNEPALAPTPPSVPEPPSQPPPDTLGPQPPSTYSGVALLGWMERDPAVRFLMQDCLFERPLTESDAESIWRKWRDRAAALPEREAPAPVPVPLSPTENTHAARFLQFVGALGVSGVQVIKIDPMQLIVGQYHIAIDVAARHAERPHNDPGWMDQLLPASPSNPQLNMNFTRRNFDTEITIDLPHAEFIFGVHSHGGFAPKELLGYVMAVKAGNRMMLGKGYHRLYSRIMAANASYPERLSLIALDPSTINPPSREAAPSNGGLDLFGSRPALFSDFFTEGLAMPVYLRKKRYRLEVQARWIAENAE
jgi:hypothetical protein